MSVKLEQLRPFSYGIAKRPRDMTRVEAQAVFDDLMAKLPGFLDYFHSVLAGEGIDLSGESAQVLQQAAEWIATRGKVIKVPSEASPMLRTDEMELDLSVPTKSACCYLGLMFADRLLKDVPDSRWVLVTEHKRDIDYHRPVVRPRSGRTQLEPIAVAINMVSRIMRKDQRSSFSTVYLLWRDALLKHDADEDAGVPRPSQRPV